MSNQTIIMSDSELAAALEGLAKAISEAHAQEDRVYLLGILSRGRPMADRLAALIAAQTGKEVHVGSLATTLYRDDIRSGKVALKVGGSETHFDFDVDGRSIVLVDDVLNSGRTIRAALDEVMDYGRPSRIQLACLIDRGLREVPIQADYLGKSIQTNPSDHVQVSLAELDGEDKAVLTESTD